MIRSVKAITAASYLCMLFLGFASSLIGAAARNIGLSPYQIGLMIAFQNIGFAAAVVAAGVLSDTYEKPRILLVGSVVLAASFLTFYLSPVFALNLVIMLCIGIGIGSYEGVTDAMLLGLHRERASLHINVNHFFVTAGGLAVTLYLLFLQMNWRSSVVQAGIGVVVLALFWGLTRLPAAGGGTTGYADRLRLLAKEKRVAILFGAALLAVGAELGLTGILTTFLIELRGFSQVTSKIGLLVLLAGVASGRLLMGLFSRKEYIPRYIVALFAFAAVLFTILFLVDVGPMTYLALFLAGIALSALLPLILTLGGLTYPDMAGTVMGTLKIAIPIGGFVIPFIMSMIARGSSLLTSLLVFPAAFLLGLVLFLGAGYLQPYPAAGRPA